MVTCIMLTLGHAKGLPKVYNGFTVASMYVFSKEALIGFGLLWLCCPARADRILDAFVVRQWTHRLKMGEILPFLRVERGSSPTPFFVC